MIVLGVDAGLANLGYALVERSGDEGVIVAKSGVVITKSRDPEEERLAKIYNELKLLCEEAYLMVLEDIFYNNHITSFKKVAKVVGVAQLAAVRSGIPVRLVSPTTIKKQIGLSGKADKQDIMNALKRDYGVEISNDHEADAVACALIGLFYEKC